MMEMIASTLGSYAVSIPIETLLTSSFDESGNAASPAIVSLKGKRLAICGESEEGRTLNAAVFKRLTGGDTLTARGLYEKPITFIPSHHIFFASNYDIALKDATDKAVKFRLKVIKFPVTFSRENGNLNDDLYSKFRERKSQEEILAWLVDGFKAYQAEGLDEPPQVKADTEGYFNANDIVGDFIREYCELGANKRINRVDLYKDYCQYYQYECGKAPMSKRSFFQVIQKRGFKTIKSGKIRYFVGIDRTSDFIHPQYFGHEGHEKNVFYITFLKKVLYREVIEKKFFSWESVQIKERGQEMNEISMIFLEKAIREKLWEKVHFMPYPYFFL